MLKKLSFLMAALFVGGLITAYGFGFISDSTTNNAPKVKSVLDFKMKDIDGKDVKLADLKAIVAACNTKGDAAARYEAVAKLVDVDLFVRDAAQLAHSEADVLYR